MATNVRPTPTRITATEAARNFSDILNRVRYRREAFVVERGGETVAEILPTQTPKRSATLADLITFLRDTRAPDDQFADDLRQIIREQPQADLTDPWER